MIDIPEQVPTGHNGGFLPCPELMTEEELAQFLRIPVLSNAKNHTNVIENLKRYHDLPCIHICRKPLYPLSSIRQWVEDKVMKEGKK
jgi:hypothetical protein